MGLSCGMSMVKYGLFIFNLVCAVSNKKTLFKLECSKVFSNLIMRKLLSDLTFPAKS